MKFRRALRRRASQRGILNRMARHGTVIDWEDTSTTTCTNCGGVTAHRWPQPVHEGDRCYCGDRYADAELARVLNKESLP